MKYSPAMVIAEFLFGQDTPLFTRPTERLTWPLYVSRFPDNDALEKESAAVYDTTPVSDGRYMDGGENVLHYGLQFTIRALSYYNGWQKANDLLALLEAVDGDTVTKEEKTYTIDNVSLASGPLPLGRVEGGKDKGREQFSINFVATLREA